MIDPWTLGLQMHVVHYSFVLYNHNPHWNGCRYRFGMQMIFFSRRERVPMDIVVCRGRGGGLRNVLGNFNQIVNLRNVNFKKGHPPLDPGVCYNFFFPCKVNINRFSLNAITQFKLKPVFTIISKVHVGLILFLNITFYTCRTSNKKKP